MENRKSSYLIIALNKLLDGISKKTNIEFIETNLLNYYVNNEFKGIAVNEVVFGESIRE